MRGILLSKPGFTNFHVNPSFHSTHVGWNWKLTRTFSEWTRHVVLWPEVGRIIRPLILSSQWDVSPISTYSLFTLKTSWIVPWAQDIVCSIWPLEFKHMKLWNDKFILKLVAVHLRPMGLVLFLFLFDEWDHSIKNSHQLVLPLNLTLASDSGWHNINEETEINMVHSPKANKKFFREPIHLFLQFTMLNFRHWIHIQRRVIEEISPL